jgi:hypothetical protein
VATNKLYNIENLIENNEKDNLRKEISEIGKLVISIQSNLKLIENNFYEKWNDIKGEMDIINRVNQETDKLLEKKFDDVMTLMNFIVDVVKVLNQNDIIYLRNVMRTD